MHGLATIMVKTFWDFLTFYQIFASPQVKQSVITSKTHGISELPHQLPNDLRLGLLGNIRKIFETYGIIA